MALDLATNAASKLEPFLLMSKAAKGAAAAKLIQDATSAPGVFVFAELLDLQSIQELQKTEQAPYLSLLQLFAYGTFPDYLKQKDTLPPLNQAQMMKLKLLTLVSLSLEQRILSYPDLLRELQMPTIRELEDLIIDGIYLDLIRGKLDQKQQQFEVEYAVGRDLEPRKIDSLLNALQQWSKTTSSVLDALDTQLDSLASQKVAHKASIEEHEQNVQATVLDVFEKHKDGKGRRLGDDDPMDIDDPKSLSSAIDPKGKKLKISSDHTKPVARKRNRF